MYQTTAQGTLGRARRYNDITKSAEGLESALRSYQDFLERARVHREKITAQRSAIREQIRNLEKHGGTEITEHDDGRKRMQLRSRERNINNLRAKEAHRTRELVSVRKEESYCRHRIRDISSRIGNLYDSVPTSI